MTFMAHSGELEDTAPMSEPEPTWLEAYPQVEEHYRVAGGDRSDEVAGELGRFFELTRSVDVPLAMVSPRMDLMWHKFIEFTEDYGPFCETNYGAMIHHRPRTASTPVPEDAVRNFRRSYEAKFGEIPAIWWDDVPDAVCDFANGKIDRLPPAYRWSGWPGRVELWTPEDSNCANAPKNPV